MTLTLMFTLSHMHTALQLNIQPIKAKHSGKSFGLRYVQKLISINRKTSFSFRFIQISAGDRTSSW